jgi:uncharacterized protein
VIVVVLAACGGRSGVTASATVAPVAPASGSAAPPASASPAPSAGPAAEEIAAYQQTVDRLTADIEAYWTVAFPAVYGEPYEPVTRRLVYHDRDDAPRCDGQRLRVANAYYCESEDFIAWDEAGLLLPFYLEIGDFAVAFVLAHEWGHAVAARADANLPLNVFGELQADCFAGAYARWADDRGTLDASAMDDAVISMYRVRDPAGTPWLDPGAHGGSLDRIRSFIAGFDEGPGLCAGYSLPTPSDLPPDAPPPS